MTLRFFATLLSLLYSTLLFAQDTVTQYSDGPAGVNPSLAGYELVLDSRLIDKGPTIEKGLVWQVFRSEADEDGKFPLVASAKGGTASFTLNEGTYLIHAAYGRAGASKKIHLSSSGTFESIILNAGGLQLNAEAENTAINSRHLKFSVFEKNENDDSEQQILAKDVPANEIIPISAGTYHVLSHYGSINATVRADLEVKAGEVTKAVLQHRGAEISLRLASHPGGDPIANTAWSVFTQDGEKVFDSKSISPSLILSEGSYEVAARNGNRNFRKTFSVQPGKNIRVEILLQ